MCSYIRFELKKTITGLIIIAILMISLVMTSPVLCDAEDDVPVFSTEEEAAVSLRESMKKRDKSIFICIKTDTAASESEPVIDRIFEKAIEHTGKPDEGDYLKFQYGTCNASAVSVTADEADAVLIKYTLTYYDDADQEKQLSGKVKEIISSLDLDEKSDAEKTESIYKYICDNVEYDYDNLADDDYQLKRTAYAALVEGKAVCQGYSAALYRLLLESGVDNRILFGTGITESGDSEDHTWNIVKLDGAYYNTDITKDDELGGEDNYLKGSDHFDEDHKRSEDYSSEEFTSAYEIPENDYGDSGISFPNHLRIFALNLKMLFQRLLGAM